MNQIIQSPNQTIALTDAPHIGATGLRTVAGATGRQGGGPRAGGTVGPSRGWPVVAIDARGFMSCYFSILQNSIFAETKYKFLTNNSHL